MSQQIPRGDKKNLFLFVRDYNIILNTLKNQDEEYILKFVSIGMK